MSDSIEHKDFITMLKMINAAECESSYDNYNRLALILKKRPVSKYLFFYHMSNLGFNVHANDEDKHIVFQAFKDNGVTYRVRKQPCANCGYGCECADQ